MQGDSRFERMESTVERGAGLRFAACRRIAQRSSNQLLSGRLRVWSLPLVCWLALSTSLLTGCSPKPTETAVEEQLKSYIDLKLTERTHLTPLSDELSRIRAQSQLPSQLQERQPPAGSEDDLTSVAEKLFASNAQVNGLHRSLDELWPADGLEFPPSALEHAQRVTQKYQPQREQMAAAVRRADSRFRIAFDQGTAADVNWLETVRLVARLESLRIAAAVYEEKPDQSLEPLASLVRLASKLEASPSLVTHLVAVDIRRYQIAGIRLVATAESSTQRTHQLLFELMAADRRKAADESLVWIGDRALGLHAYEMVRSGEYLSLLSEEDYQALVDKNETTDQALVVRRNVDDDELFFLETMSLMIEQSKLPFYRRKERMDEWFTQLDERATQPKFPTVAADILLVGVTTGQQRLARGVARRDAWLLALASVTNQTLSSDPLMNAETGEPLVVSDDGSRVEVWGLVEEDSDLFPSVTRRNQ